MTGWEPIEPRVNETAEFLEIASDFGDPMELFREALHNAYDWGATLFQISINEENILGQDKIVIELVDNGSGMDKETLMKNFWNLGDSKSKGNHNSIGEKGHGTKIYLRSDKVIVHTYDGEHHYESFCEGAFKQLNSGNIHQPFVRECEDVCDKGTSIRIEGYNNNQSARFTQAIIKDYLYWFTVLGTVENQFDDRSIREFKVTLKALDVDEPEELSMGHPFAAENNNIDDLFKVYGENAADHYVKKFIYANRSLPSKPQVKYDVVIYFEGDAAKRKYNKMISDRKNKARGTYKVSDRYGIYLCKDFVPIQRVNDWITSFGLGSNSLGLLHGFINCQKLKLTANRGSISNTNLDIIDELRSDIQTIISEINTDLYKKEIAFLMEWKEQTHVLAVEQEKFKIRKEIIAKKQYFTVDKRIFLVPRNETELYGLFISLYTLRPDDFDFEPLDYDASIGIDLLARNKTKNPIADCDFWYVELKYQLGAKVFNHSFTNIRKIVCWDLAPDIKHGSTLKSQIENEERELEIEPGEGEEPRALFLKKKRSDLRIGVICLKDYVTVNLKAEIHNP